MLMTQPAQQLRQASFPGMCPVEDALAQLAQAGSGYVEIAGFVCHEKTFLLVTGSSGRILN